VRDLYGQYPKTDDPLVLCVIFIGRGGKAIEGMWGFADVDQMLRGETMPPSNVAVAGVAEFDAGEGARGVAEGWLHGGGGIASYYVSALKSEVMADLR
jgi:hypothetical protein